MAKRPYQLPTLLHEAQQMLVDVERVVRTFPRYHRYATGSDLREQARIVCRTVNRAWFNPNERKQLAGELVDRIEDLKLELQIAKRVGAFPKGFGAFNQLARQAYALGRQAGGWRRSIHPVTAQNAQGDAIAQRGQELSTHAAHAPARANA